jgi:hypothetical protein
MANRRSVGLAIFVWILHGCAATVPPATPPASADALPVDSASASSAPPAAPPSAPVAVPNACAPGDTDTCMPGVSFADKVCAASRPDVALVLFAKGSPWARLYLKGDVDGWNAEGGGSSRARLAFDEEVVVLKKRAPGGPGAISVGGSTGYQVMRWDGNCYSLDEGEVTRRRPPKAKHPSIPWRYLDETWRNALLGDAGVKAAYSKRGKECKGVTLGDVSLACEKADTAFSDAIVGAVQSGVALPTPKL